jgi:transglutaminase-like putative cysteine protease
MHIAPQITLTARAVNLAGGVRGTMQTLRQMRVFADEGSMSTQILNAAIAAIFTAPAKQDWAEVLALFEMVRNSIRYTRDVFNVETLSTPEMTLARRVGDCDDMATLLAALCQSVGFPTRFVAVGYQASGEYDHVYLEVCVDGAWTPCDATELYPMGWEPPAPVSKFVERV